MKRVIGIFIGLLATPSIVLGAVTQVQGMRVSASSDKTRVVLDLDRPLTHNLFTLTGPDRVVLDLNASSTVQGFTDPKPAGLLKQIRHAPKPKSKLRVVFDVGEAVQPRSFLLPPKGEYGHRLVIDLIPRDGVVAPTLKRTQRDIIIAIDAGHGGKDPGATGPGGLREKDVVLQIAKRLASLVDKQPGMRSFLIRDDDTFVSLGGRAVKARQANADFFVSIHADGFPDARARGSSVFVLSQSGATSEAARWLAERENAADLVGGVKLDDKDDVLASVLLDLSQTATISASMRAARKVLKEIGNINRLHSRSVKQAGFVVLKSPDVPSIFVEAAFISNPEEARKLRNPSHQAAMAQAILTGIHGYFESSPPSNTKVASLVRPKNPQAVRHVILNGDTLSEIAARYNVPLRRLRTANGLKNDRIRIGQTLKIPEAI